MKEAGLSALAKDLTAKADQGEWVPACNGTEEPFTTRNGIRLLYCWHPSTGKHAYLNCDTDIILSDDEAALALGMATATE